MDKTTRRLIQRAKKAMGDARATGDFQYSNMINRTLWLIDHGDVESRTLKLLEDLCVKAEEQVVELSR